MILRVAAEVPAHRRVVADRDEAPVLDRDRLRDAPVLVDRDDMPAAQHEVGGLGEGGGGEEGEEQGEAQAHEALRFLSPLPQAGEGRREGGGRGPGRARSFLSRRAASLLATLSRKRERGKRRADASAAYFTNFFPVIRSRFL